MLELKNNRWVDSITNNSYSNNLTLEQAQAKEDSCINCYDCNSCINCYDKKDLK